MKFLRTQCLVCIRWIPGFLGFSNSVYETWIWITQIVELQKSFPMTLNSNQFPGNWTSKITFLTFAWAFEWVGIFGQIFYVDQKMRNKIPHLSMSSQKGFEWKAVKKLKFSAEIIKTIRIHKLMLPRWRSWHHRWTNQKPRLKQYSESLVW